MEVLCSPDGISPSSLLPSSTKRLREDFDNDDIKPVIKRQRLQEERHISKITPCFRPLEFSVRDLEQNAFQITDIDYYVEKSYSKTPQCQCMKPPYPVIRLHGATESGVRVIMLIYDFLPTFQVRIADQEQADNTKTLEDYYETLVGILRRSDIKYTFKGLFSSLPWRPNTTPIPSLTVVKEKVFVDYSPIEVASYNIAYRDPYMLNALRAICERGFSSINDNQWLTVGDIDEDHFRRNFRCAEKSSSSSENTSTTYRDDEKKSARGAKYKPQHTHEWSSPPPPSSSSPPTYDEGESQEEQDNNIIRKYVPPKHTVYNTELKYIEEFMCRNNTTGSSWVSLNGAHRVSCSDEYNLSAMHVYEINIENYRSLPDRTQLLSNRILSFDIECEGRIGIFPEPEHDAVIQIGNVFYDQTITADGKYHIAQQSVFVLHKCAPLGTGIKTWWFSRELDMLISWFQYVLDCDPDIITGFNIGNFDIWYLFKRMEALGSCTCTHLSNVKSHVASIKEMMVGNNSYKRMMRTVRVPGRLILDMYVYYTKNEKRRSYSLNSIAADELGDQKDDIHYTQISVLHQGTSLDRRKLAKYCLKDALLPGRLLNKKGLATYYQCFARASHILIEHAAMAGEAKKVFGALSHYAIFLYHYQIPSRGTYQEKKLYRSRYIGDRTALRKGYELNALDFRDEYEATYKKQNGETQDDIDASLLAGLADDENTTTITNSKKRKLPDRIAVNQSLDDEYGVDAFCDYACDQRNSSDDEDDNRRSDQDDDNQQEDDEGERNDEEEEEKPEENMSTAMQKRSFMSLFQTADPTKKITKINNADKKSAKRRKLNAEKLTADKSSPDGNTSSTIPLDDFVEGLRKSIPLENLDGLDETEVCNLIARWLLRWIGEIKEFKGATVLKALTGYYLNPIVVLDFEGLYASIMRAHNLCFSTGLSLEEVLELGIENCHQSPSGYWFVNQNVRESIVKIFVDITTAKRKEAKKGKLNPDKVLADNADKEQNALKLLCNSVYGYMGCPYGQIDAKLSIATSITAYGRQMLEMCVRIVESVFTKANGYKYDAKVIYGDTDSIMIDFGPISMEEAFELGEKARIELNKHFIKPINIEFEKIYCPYLLSSKKRYIGVMYVDPKNPNKYKEIDSKGTEDKRRDSVLLVSMLIKQITKILMIDKDVEKMCQLMRNVVESLSHGDIDHSLLVMSSELKKFDYKVPQKHCELAKRIKARTPGNAPTIGDRIQFIIRERNDKTGSEAQQKKREPDNQLAEDPVYAIEHNIPLNIKYYIENQLTKPLQKIMVPVIGNQKFNKLMQPPKHRIIRIDEDEQSKKIELTKKRKRSQIDGHYEDKMKCIGCRKPVTDNTYLCKQCNQPEQRIIVKQSYQTLYEQELTTKNESWMQCYQCVGSSLVDIHCPQKDCPNFYVRQESIKKCDGFLKQIEHIDALPSSTSS